MMKIKKIIKAILGLNVIAFYRLATYGPKQFFLACQNAFIAAYYVNSNGLQMIPEVDIRDILKNKEPEILLTTFNKESGALPLEQYIALISILVAEHPTDVLEIGTFTGKTTKTMADNLPFGTIHTVDLPPDFQKSNDTKSEIPKDDFHLIERRVVGKAFKGTPSEKRIKQYFADTAQWDFKTSGRPTFFFIDGSHTYGYCKNDSEKCLEWCKGGEVLLWHDCDNRHPGVVKFILEWRKQGRNIVRIKGTPLGYWKVR